MAGSIVRPYALLMSRTLPRTAVGALRVIEWRKDQQLCLDIGYSQGRLPSAVTALDVILEREEVGAWKWEVGSCP
jgi:hypothetical protein